MSSSAKPKRSVVRTVVGVLLILGGLGRIVVNIPPASSYQLGVWTGSIILIIIGLVLLRPKKEA
jgi:hypothetical protein